MGFLTITQLLADLQGRGFVHAFAHMQLGLSSPDTDQQWSPEEYEVVESYHYRKAGKPVGSIVVLAIQTRTGHKGILMDTCGEISAPDGYLPSAPPRVALEH